LIGRREDWKDFGFGAVRGNVVGVMVFGVIMEFRHARA